MSETHKRIELTFENRTDFSYDPRRAEAAISQTLDEHSFKRAVLIELILVEPEAMQKLNQEFRAKDYVADVLSFPHWPDLATLEKIEVEPLSLGSIIVCPDIAKTACLENQRTPEEEIDFYIAHSTLHLIGIHHEGDL